MSDPHRSIDFLRSIRDEAERLLYTFDTTTDDDDLLAIDSMHSTAGGEDHPTPQDEQSEPFATSTDLGNALLQILSITLLVFLAWTWSKGVQQARTDPTLLGFHGSCGSSFKSRQRWWPVLGPPSPSLLSTIRSKYCGDAYINENNVLQIASFNTWDDAYDFKNRLEAATVSTFRIGDSVYR